MLENEHVTPPGVSPRSIAQDRLCRLAGAGPSHLLRLRDGRLLMTYGYRRAPFGNLARISEDHGRTWSAALVISDDGAGSDLGYPSTVELADGQLVTVWYERLRDSPQAALRRAQWSIG